MSDSEMEVPVDASAATDRDTWLSLIDQIGEEEGYFQTLGPRHWAMFIDDGPVLLVSFETIESARARPGQMPLAHSIAAAKGWSHLCLIADGATWFRDPAVWGYFDRLVDEAFFEDFDNVTFYGAGALAYAACAYCVAAPGARVLALNPIATLSPAIAGWDSRHRAARRLDFTSRYGYAPDMTDGAAQLSVICDPLQRVDQMHAALFLRPQTRFLTARHGGADLEALFARLGVLDHLIILAAEGRLDAASFAALWRKRVDDTGYLRNLLSAVESRGGRRMVEILCENVVRRLNVSRFRKRLVDLKAAPNTLAAPSAVEPAE